MSLSKEDLGFIGIIAVIALIFFYIILGFSGMMSALGIILIFIVPTYFIIDNFNLETDEKVVFSFFLGAGIFPSIAYWLGILMSFKLAILVTFVLLLAVGFLVKKFKKS
ncbi:hypothetical protein KY347_03225 [Candidatus Woesearchaeota archaeon]|nr:hypothetical protein [Candidatus Woesearchaeota archaeon]